MADATPRPPTLAQVIAKISDLAQKAEAERLAVDARRKTQRELAALLAAFDGETPGMSPAEVQEADGQIQAVIGKLKGLSGSVSNK